jgi:diguanylate cyclase (GGDEF)-like protein
MSYSAAGLIAAIVLLIENKGILSDQSGDFKRPVWRAYRAFLLAVLAYYATDILWGFFESAKMPVALFADTSLYFVAMAAGILCFTRYAVAYLDERSGLDKVLLGVGRAIALLVTLLVAINCFVPILFTVDAACVYHALPSRYFVLIAQTAGLLALAIYALTSMRNVRDQAKMRQRYESFALFGLITAACLIAQMWFPYLPLYAFGYLLGTCILHAFVVAAEMEEFRLELQDAAKAAEFSRSISALLDAMPGMSFSKDAATGVYLACNKAFAEYAHKDSPEGVVGLTDAQIFDAATAAHFVEDDHMALTMNEPYVFFENVPDAIGNPRELQTTKLLFVDGTGRLCTLGLCQDVTDVVRIQRENATTKEAYEKARQSGIVYAHIAQSLLSGYTNLFYVDLDSDEYVEYSTDQPAGSLVELRRGERFFEECKIEAECYIHPDDLERFVGIFDRQTLLEQLEDKKVAMASYRQLTDEGYRYVNTRISGSGDAGNFIVIATLDVDERMRQQIEAERLKEERDAFARVNVLNGDYLCLYVVDPDTLHYREYSISKEYEPLTLSKDGTNFFVEARTTGGRTVHPDDRERFLALFSEDIVRTAIAQDGVFALTCRMITGGEPFYVQIKAAMNKEGEKLRLIVGLTDVDASMRQELHFEQQIAQARRKANRDALTGVKNRHAYLEAEKDLDQLIATHQAPEFAIVILDVNDLKLINDNAGHQVGDQYIRDACKVVCNVFKHSPVFRVGGDEFAVISRGDDYANMESLLVAMDNYNKGALSTGGAVVACGMARYEDDQNVAAVFERADQQMYANKHLLKTTTR